MRSEGYCSLVVRVCLSVCLSTTILTTGNEADSNSFSGTWARKIKWRFCWRSRATNWHGPRSRTALRGRSNPSISGAHACIRRLDLIRLLCVRWRRKKPQRRVCIDSRMLSTTVASQCQTLCELLAGDRE